MQITFETKKRKAGFYILRQGVPEGRSNGEYASFKQVKSWPWHVEVIPGVSVVELVTDAELCMVAWGIIIKNLRERERQTDRQRQREGQREGQRQTDR